MYCIDSFQEQSTETNIADNGKAVLVYTGLNPHTRYTLRVGSKLGFFSEFEPDAETTFEFRTKQEGINTLLCTVHVFLLPLTIPSPSSISVLRFSISSPSPAKSLIHLGYSYKWNSICTRHHAGVLVLPKSAGNREKYSASSVKQESQYAIVISM